MTTSDTTNNDHAAFGGDGGNGGNSGGNTITVGNGNNIITDFSGIATGGAGGSASVTTPSSSIAAPGSVGASGTSGNDIITVGTGNNTINLGGHNNDTVILGTDAGYSATSPTANQTIENAAAGDLIGFASLTSGSPTLLNDGAATGLLALIADVTGHAGKAAYGSWGGNTYLVESATGTPGSGDTVIVEVTGTHGFSISGTHLLLS
jgi:hypothetical protein